MKRDISRLSAVAAALWIGACGSRSADTDVSRGPTPPASDPPTRDAESNSSNDDTSRPIDPESQPDCSGQQPAQPNEPSPSPPNNPSPNENDDPIAPDDSPQTNTPIAQACSTEPSPCGGDVVGSWKVLNCPLELTGEVNLAGFGLGCLQAPITSGSLQVSGSWTVNADGSLTDETVTTGTQQFEVPAACFDVSGSLVTCERLVGPLYALGYASLECLDNADTGVCICNGSFEQQGGLAAISLHPARTGSYTTTDRTVVTDDLGWTTTYNYCVTGDNLVLTLPTPNNVGTLEGPIVLQRQ